MVDFEIGKDISKIVHLFFRIAKKKKRQNVDPEYIGKYLTTSVVLVGRPEVVSKWGSKPYINYIKRASRKGVDVFYVLASGVANSLIAKDVTEELRKTREFEVIQCYEAKDRNNLPKAFLAYLVVNNRKRFKQMI